MVGLFYVWEFLTTSKVINKNQIDFLRHVVLKLPKPCVLLRSWGRHEVLGVLKPHAIPRSLSSVPPSGRTR